MTLEMCDYCSFAVAKHTIRKQQYELAFCSHCFNSVFFAVVENGWQPDSETKPVEPERRLTYDSPLPADVQSDEVRIWLDEDGKPF